MPPKSRQVGVFAPNPTQTMDSEEKIAPDPFSLKLAPLLNLQLKQKG